MSPPYGQPLEWSTLSFCYSVPSPPAVVTPFRYRFVDCWLFPVLPKVLTYSVFCLTQHLSFIISMLLQALALMIQAKSF